VVEQHIPEPVDLFPEFAVRHPAAVVDDRHVIVGSFRPVEQHVVGDIAGVTEQLLHMLCHVSFRHHVAGGEYFFRDRVLHDIFHCTPIF
jgi:hypothetical protein